MDIVVYKLSSNDTAVVHKSKLSFLIFLKAYNR